LVSWLGVECGSLEIDLHMLLVRRLLPSISFSLGRTMSSSSKVPSSGDVKPVQGRSFRIALVQLGGTVADKSANIGHAKSKLLEAVKGGREGKKPDLVVLPVCSCFLSVDRVAVVDRCSCFLYVKECFNSPYGVDYFSQYAENIGFDRSKGYDVEESESETVKMLSSVAKDTGVWIIGGKLLYQKSCDLF
jgi:omega-amidase